MTFLKSVNRSAVADAATASAVDVLRGKIEALDEGIGAGSTERDRLKAERRDLLLVDDDDQCRAALAANDASLSALEKELANKTDRRGLLQDQLTAAIKAEKDAKVEQTTAPLRLLVSECAALERKIDAATEHVVDLLVTHHGKRVLVSKLNAIALAAGRPDLAVTATPSDLQNVIICDRMGSRLHPTMWSVDEDGVARRRK